MSIDSIKLHFKNNKQTYLACGTTAVVVGVVTFAFSRTVVGDGVAQKITQVGVFYKTNPTIITLIENSTPSKPVHLVGSDLYFNSINEAARKTGHNLSAISKNVNGLIPNVKGDVFELLEPAA